MKKFFFAAATLFVVGCASQPDDIQTAYVSEVRYQDYDCEQLQLEAKAVTRRAADLRRTLQKDADNDAAQAGIGLVLFWPALFLLEGGDGVEAEQYARLKGEREALERVALQKKCEIKFYDPSRTAEPGPTFQATPNSSGDIAGLRQPTPGEKIDGRILHTLVNGAIGTGQLRLCLPRASNPTGATSKVEISFRSDGRADISIDCNDSQSSRSVAESFIANWQVSGNQLCFRNVPENGSSFKSKCADVIYNRYEYLHETGDGGALGFTLSGNDLPTGMGAQIFEGFELTKANTKTN